MNPIDRIRPNVVGSVILKLQIYKIRNSTSKILLRKWKTEAGARAVTAILNCNVRKIGLGRAGTEIHPLDLGSVSDPKSGIMIQS